MPVSTEREQLAEKLLDAQVQFIMSELSGPRLTEVIARDTDDILDLLDKLVVADAVSAQDIKDVARRYVEAVGDSPLIELLATQIADAIYALADADDHTLGEVIGREHVEQLVAKVLAMRMLRDRLFERLAESPAVATVASWFVNKIVTDFLDANAKRAERIPGVGQMFGAGRRAAGAVRGQADRHLGDVLGDVAGRGARLALLRLSTAIKETMDEAPLQRAVMETWDLQAQEPMSNLREYLSRRDLRDLVLSIHEIWLTLRETEYFAAAVDAGIDVFFENYGAFTVGDLLRELGVEREQIAADAQVLVPGIVEAIRETGVLEPLVRARLEPFWMSDEVLSALGR